MTREIMMRETMTGESDYIQSLETIARDHVIDND